MTHHKEKVSSAIEHLAAEYLNREASGLSLITVTSSDISNKGDRITIKFSVFPAEQERRALDFARRHISDLREYIKEHIRMRALPKIEFEIDRGEKNRQRIEELLKKSKTDN